MQKIITSKYKKPAKNKKLSGYYLDMPDESYFEYPALSRSDLTSAYRDIFKYHKHKTAKSQHNTSALYMGTALHKKVLEPKIFNKQYHVDISIENRVCSEYRQLKKDIDGSKQIIVSKDAEILNGMHDALFENKFVREMLEADGFCEISGFTYDKHLGNMKHRFDKLLFDDRALDLKTIRNASTYRIKQSINQYSYFMQCAFYSDEYKKITGRDLKQFIFAFVESSFPFKVVPAILDSQYIQFASVQLKKAKNHYAKYLNNEFVLENNHDLFEVNFEELIK